MTRMMRAGLILCLVAITWAASVQAQFRGVPEWTTSRHDAQRTAWVRTDARLTKEAVQRGAFAFLWKAAFENESRQLNALTEPILQDQLIGYRGFKSLAFVGGSADRLFAIDTDLARPYWMSNVTYGASTGGQPPSTIECPGGLMATPSRRTILAPSTFGTGGFGGGRGGSMSSAVGEPGKGAAVLSQRRPAATPAAPAAASRAAASSVVAPIPFGGVDPLYVMGADGLLRTLRVSDGAETSARVPFIPPSATPSSLIFLDGIVYTSTSNGCGAAPNAVWAVDLTVPEHDRKVVSWTTGGPDIVGVAGPAFGTDGTVYVAVGNTVGNGSMMGTSASAATDGHGVEMRYANAVVALDRHTLRPKDWFTTAGASFTTSPTIIHDKDKDLIAATANDGRLYLLDAASLGGSDHKTPLFVTEKYTNASAGGGLATWDDGTTRWILAAVTGGVDPSVRFTTNGPAPQGSIVAFKLVDRGGKIALEAGWQSRGLPSPLAPIVVNGLVMAASSGEYRGPEGSLSAAARAQRSTPAVLYVLDGMTGKELWTSGHTITTFATAGLSAGGGQVYLVTYDNQLYAFGIPMEH